MLISLQRLLLKHEKLHYVVTPPQNPEGRIQASDWPASFYFSACRFGMLLTACFSMFFNVDEDFF